MRLFDYRGLSVGVEIYEGQRTLVSYLIPMGSGFMVVDGVDIARIQDTMIPESKKVRRALDKVTRFAGGVL
jgi:hypothetical protein